MDERFVEIFNLFKDDIFRLAFSYTRDRRESEDVSQNVFVKLYRHSRILERDTIEIKKWLFRVTINECKTIFLSSWFRKVKSSINKHDGSYVEHYDEVIEEVLKLPVKQRLIVYFYYYEDYSIREISEIMNITETNIQTILARARAKLKKTLKEE